MKLWTNCAPISNWIERKPFSGRVISLFIVSVFFAFVIGLFAQISSPAVSPADRQWTHPISPVHISGSFAEYRHYGRYHPGLDYKTFNRTGLPVMTPEAGFVENVHIADTGYGNALFIHDIHGEVLVFGHLQDFLGIKPELESFRQAVQLLRTQELSFFPIPAWFTFNKGDVIARSGESGVGAPHLHFEIRTPAEFVDPLSLPGMSVHDHSAPELLTLYLETDGVTRSFPCEKIEDGETDQEGHTIQKYRPIGGSELKISPFSESLRFQIGLYDTMATRNKNGIYGISIESSGKEVFRRVFDQISYRDFTNAASVYNTALTVIGKEYVYLLYESSSASHGVFTAPEFLKLASGGPRVEILHQGAPFRIRAFDSTGNTSILDIELLFDTDSKPSPDAENAGAFQEVRNDRTRTITYATSQTYVELPFVPDSIIYPARVRITPLVEIPAEMLNSRYSENQYVRVGEAFSIEGRELYYRNGVNASVSMIDSGDPRVALYNFNTTSKRWRLAALPAGRAGGRVFYRFMFRSTGPMAQLIDASAPTIEKPLFWDSAPDDLEKYHRDFQVRERGSGVSMRNSSVLLDGLPLPFEWVDDRSVISVEIPSDMISDQGSMLSLQAGDSAGNLSLWHFEFIGKSKKQYRN